MGLYLSFARSPSLPLEIIDTLLVKCLGMHAGNSSFPYLLDLVVPTYAQQEDVQSYMVCNL